MSPQSTTLTQRTWAAIGHDLFLEGNGSSMALDTGGGCSGAGWGDLKRCVLSRLICCTGSCRVGRWEQGYKPRRLVPVSSLPPYQTNRGLGLRNADTTARAGLPCVRPLTVVRGTSTVAVLHVVSAPDHSREGVINTVPNHRHTRSDRGSGMCRHAYPGAYPVEHPVVLESFCGCAVTPARYNTR